MQSLGEILTPVECSARSVSSKSLKEILQLPVVREYAGLMLGSNIRPSQFLS
jgi:hypothetical protein